MALTHEQLIDLTSKVSSQKLLESLTLLTTHGYMDNGIPIYTRCCNNTPAHSDDVADTIEDMMRAVGLTSFSRHVEYDVPYPPIWHNFCGVHSQVVNLISIIPGSEYPNKYIIISAHSDSISDPNPWMLQPDGTRTYAPGADDNGSGVCALIEVARVLIESNFIPKYSIMFLQSGAEEVDCLGTDKLLDAWDEDKEIIVNLNMDMIGFCPDRNTDWGFRLHCYDTDENNWLDPDGTSFWAKSLNLMQTYTSLNWIPGDDHSCTPNAAGSNCFSFWRHGYKAVYLEEWNRSTHYHSQNDTVATIDFDFYAEHVKGLLAMVAYFSTDVPVPKTIAERYAEGYKIGSSSNPTRPINGEDLTILEDVSGDVRICKVKDLVPGSNGMLNLLDESANPITLEVLSGIIHSIT